MIVLYVRHKFLVAPECLTTREFIVALGCDVLGFPKAYPLFDSGPEPFGKDWFFV